jgi:hypothetical protein
MGKEHQSHMEPAQPKSETNALSTPKKSNIINRKQTPPVQNNTQNHLDLGIQPHIPTLKYCSVSKQSLSGLLWTRHGIHINKYRIQCTVTQKVE